MWNKLKFLLSFKDMADGLIAWLKGKKTVLGAIPLLLWALMYGIPAVAPEYAWLAAIGTKIKEFLESMGLVMDKELLVGGAGITAIGLFDKLRRMIFGDGKD